MKKVVVHCKIVPEPIPTNSLSSWYLSPTCAEGNIYISVDDIRHAFTAGLLEGFYEGGYRYVDAYMEIGNRMYKVLKYTFATVDYKIFEKTEHKFIYIKPTKQVVI